MLTYLLKHPDFVLMLLAAGAFTHWHLGFQHLVWLNAGTTILVLAAVPFLPRALADRREGEGEAEAATP